jgi:plastocyanin
LLAIALGALAIGVPGVGCGSGDSGTSSTSPAASEQGDAAGTVAAVDFAFEPGATSIKAGEAVTWTNNGETIHNVKGKGFFSEAINPGESYEHRFTKPGTYDYLCNLHPDQMRGSVEVSG